MSRSTCRFRSFNECRLHRGRDDRPDESIALAPFTSPAPIATGRVCHFEAPHSDNARVTKFYKIFWLADFE